MANTGTATIDNISEFEMGVETEDPSTVANAFKWPSKLSSINETHLTSIIYIDEQKEWLKACTKQITKLLSLEDDWNSYGAEAPNQWTVDCARELLKSLASEDLEPSNINASAEGGICLSFKTKTHYSDIECFNTGEVFVVTSENGENTKVWEIQESEFGTTVNHIQSFLQM